MWLAHILVLTFRDFLMASILSGSPWAIGHMNDHGIVETSAFLYILSSHTQRHMAILTGEMSAIEDKRPKVICWDPAFNKYYPNIWSTGWDLLGIFKWNWHLIFFLWWLWCLGKHRLWVRFFLLLLTSVCHFDFSQIIVSELTSRPHCSKCRVQRSGDTNYSGMGFAVRRSSKGTTDGLEEPLMVSREKLPTILGPWYSPPSWLSLSATFIWVLWMSTRGQVGDSQDL